MCCGNGGGSRPAAQTRQRQTVRKQGPASTWKVTLPDGQELTGLTEHQALMATLKNGGGMEPEQPAALLAATPRPLYVINPGQAHVLHVRYDQVRTHLRG